MKACLVDFTTQRGLVVPWMIFDSIEEAVAARVDGHSSWPTNVCEVDMDKPVKHVPSRRAAQAREGDRFRGEWIAAFKAESPVRPYFELAKEFAAAAPGP